MSSNRPIRAKFNAFPSGVPRWGWHRQKRSAHLTYTEDRYHRQHCPCYTFHQQCRIFFFMFCTVLSILLTPLLCLTAGTCIIMELSMLFFGKLMIFFFKLIRFLFPRVCITLKFFMKLCGKIIVLLWNILWHQFKAYIWMELKLYIHLFGLKILAPPPPGQFCSEYNTPMHKFILVII